MSSSSSVNPRQKLCKCGEVAVVVTSKKPPNAGKWFYGCPFYDVELGFGGCGLFKWCPDQNIARGAPASVRDYRDVVSREDLKKENDELAGWVENVREDNRKLVEDNKNLIDMVESVNNRNKLLKLKVKSLEDVVKMTGENRGRGGDVQLKVALVIVLLVVIACRII